MQILEILHFLNIKFFEFIPPNGIRFLFIFKKLLNFITPKYVLFYHNLPEII